MHVLSPYPEIRIGIDQMAKDNPRKAYRALARRNALHVIPSLAAAEIGTQFLAAELAKDFLTSGQLNHMQNVSPKFFEDFFSTNLTHDHLATGLAFGTAASVVLAIGFLGSSVFRGIQAARATSNPKK